MYNMVQPTKEYKTKEPSNEIGANYITCGELAMHSAKLIKDFYTISSIE